jgi:hypothetical protein
MLPLQTSRSVLRFGANVKHFVESFLQTLCHRYPLTQATLTVLYIAK